MGWVGRRGEEEMEIIEISTTGGCRAVAKRVFDVE